MPILTIAQMKTHINSGVQQIVSQGDNTKLQDAIDAAIAEAKGYCSRFLLDPLFDNVAEPDAVLLLHLKNMAKWHFLVLANPAIDYEDALNRYERAIAWLKEVQNGKVVPVNWQPAIPEDKSTFFHVSSNRKRGNHF